MSYDFDLFCRTARTLPSSPRGSDFEVNIEGPLDVELEDINTSVVKVTGTKRKLYQIRIEGSLDQAAQSKTDLWLKDVIRATSGVLIDLQQDTFETKTKTGILKTSSQTTAQSYLMNGSMSFHFLDAEWFYQQGFEAFLTLIATYLPEALPNRFDSVEPMQGKLEGTDFSGMIAHFQNEWGLFFWSSKTPFAGGSLSVMSKKKASGYHPDHHDRQSVIVSKCEIEIRPKAFDDPILLARILVFFEKVCLELDVLYAQITKTDWSGPSWFWNGLPDEPTFATCLSEAYYSAWPEFTESSTEIGPHHRLCVTDRFGNTPPLPPSKMVETIRYGVVKNGYAQKEITRAEIFPIDVQADEKGRYW